MLTTRTYRQTKQTVHSAGMSPRSQTAAAVASQHPAAPGAPRKIYTFKVAHSGISCHQNGAIPVASSAFFCAHFCW